jgi:hypothetical protein
LVKFKEKIMRDKMRFAGKLVSAGALTVLLATAAVAAPAQRNGGQWDSGRNTQQYNNGNRDNRRSVRQAAVRGVVARIDSRRGTMTVRDQATGRLINIDMQRMSGRGLRGLRRGDFVTVSGQWERGNAFVAYRIS